MNLDDIKKKAKDSISYKNYFLNLQNLEIKISNNNYGDFGNGLIINDYEDFIEKVKHRILPI